MKKITIFSSILLAVFNSCSDHNGLLQIATENDGQGNGVIMTIPEFVVSENDATTRTLLTATDASISFAWEEGDEVGIYTSSSSMANFRIDQISQNAKSATFDGGGFSLTKGATYYAFYPYDGTATDKTTIPVDYTGQMQVTNNNCSHLAAYDYMAAVAPASGSNRALFNFSHLGAILKINIILPQDGVYTKLSIGSTKNITTNGYVDFTVNHPSITPTQFSKNIVLDLDNVTSTNKSIKTYLILPPGDFSEDFLNCSITDVHGDVYYGMVMGTNMEAGKLYEYTMTTSINPLHNGHEYVDLGLKNSNGKPVFWATCNIGAESPADYGDYFQWGRNFPTNNGWCIPSGQPDTYDEGETFIKYRSDRKTVLEWDDDAASVQWGGNWRMPSKKELEDLCANCYWGKATMINSEGVSICGYKFSNKNDSRKYIFLPAAGMRSGEFNYEINMRGRYWSNSLDTSDEKKAWHYYFEAEWSSLYEWCFDEYRYNALSVRAVCVLNN